MSTLSAFPFIGEQSFATPGSINSPLSIISANIAAINTDVGAISGVTISPPSGNTIQMPSDLSISGYLSVGKGVSIGTQAPGIAEPVALTIGVNSGISDYIYLNDTANLRSDYLIGSHAGGTADGLNIFDVSGNTMIVSFSKQSIRFFQQVVGPVFDLGGALTDTLNAATFGTGADSDESRIQGAIDAASLGGISRVYIPASMYPYSASSVSFIYTVQMVREGGNYDVCDVQAYGAHPTLAGGSSTSALQEAIKSGASQGRLVYIPAGAYSVTTLRYFSGSVIRGVAASASGTPPAQLYQASASGPILQPDTVAASTRDFAIEDITLSSFGNTANLGGIDCENCVRFAIRRVAISGTSSFAIRVTGGPAAGDAGFGVVEDCYIVSLPNAGCAFMLVGTANDQPDGMVFTNNFINLSNGTMLASLSSVNRGPSAPVFVANRLESSGTDTSVVTGRLSAAVFLGNRFETTHSAGTLRVALNPKTVGGTESCAAFIANVFAAPGGLAWNDNGAKRSPRWLEVDTGPIFRSEVWDGTAVNPAYAFGSESSLGWYRSAASALGLSYGQLQVPAGTALQPSLAFSSESSLGFFRSAASTLELSYGTLTLPLNATFLLRAATSTGVRIFEAGDVGYLTFNRRPSFAQDSTALASWTVEANYNTTGDFTIAHNNPAGGGVNVGSLTSAGAWRTGDGITLIPTSAFLSEVSLGMFRSGASIIKLSYGQLSVDSGSNTTPGLGFSTTSLGFYRAGLQTISQSTGTFDLATNSVRLSMRTAASLDSTTLAVNEVAFSIQPGSSGASLAIRSGGTIFYFASSNSTKAP